MRAVSGDVILWENDTSPVPWLYLEVDGLHYGLSIFSLEVTELSQFQPQLAKVLGQVPRDLLLQAIQFVRVTEQRRLSTRALSQSMDSDETIQKLRVKPG